MTDAKTQTSDFDDLVRKLLKVPPKPKKKKKGQKKVKELEDKEVKS
jgi:hypothetical protein